MSSIRRTIGEEVADKIIPCINVRGEIVVRMPFTSELFDERNRSDRAKYREDAETLLRCRRSLAKYIDRKIARGGK